MGTWWGILPTMNEIHCIISGRVQNVGFRDYVQRAAGTCLVSGWVRNQGDGTVELVAQGTPDALKEFVEHLHEGSIAARVESVSVEWRTARETYDDFSIRYD